MMPQPAAPANRQNCDTLRLYTSPRGFPDLEGGPVYPSKADLLIDAGTDVMCHLRHCSRRGCPQTKTDLVQTCSPINL